jgi:multidrug efflux pump subunit AcrA (membrane-fusion protein)
MKHLFSMALLITLLLAAFPVAASSLPAPSPLSCAALVLRVPAGGVGLPVKSAPTWFSVDAPGVLQVGQTVTVYATEQTGVYAEVWFQLAGGWAQAYSGPSTNVTQLVLIDPSCGALLP